MENKNSEKTAAEIYREERKKRLEKSAKKNAKKSPELTKFRKGVAKVIAVVLSVIIILGACYGILNFFGISQKILSAAKVGDERISVAKYNYYYMRLYSNIAQTATQYEQQYGSGMGKMYTGYDVNLSPSEQEYTASDLGLGEGKTAYWSDYFRITALDMIHQYTTYYNEAVAEGIRLTEDQEKEIDDAVEQLREYAKKNDYSLNRYLSKQLGSGMNEELLREIYKEQTLAQSLYQVKYAEFEDAQTDDTINKEYAENIKDYALVSVRIFTFKANAETTDEMSDEEKTAAQETALKDAKAKADAALANITDEASFISVAQSNSDTDGYNASTATLSTDATYSGIQQSYGTNTADWIYDAERKVGDVGLLEGNSQYVLAYIVQLPYKDMNYPVNVRHILLKFTTDDNGTNTMSEKEMAALKEQAQSLLDEFNAAPSEDAFAELAKSNSQDEGSASNGGLYEDVQPGQMVTAFNDWCFDESRKPGDTGIVETEYGYHIMYFSGKSEHPVWYSNVKSALASNAYEAFEKDLLEKNEIKENEKIIVWASKQCEKVIDQAYINS
jgi:hypothetical protein